MGECYAQESAGVRMCIIYSWLWSFLLLKEKSSISIKGIRISQKSRLTFVFFPVFWSEVFAAATSRHSAWVLKKIGKVFSNLSYWRKKGVRRLAAVKSVQRKHLVDAKSATAQKQGCYEMREWQECAIFFLPADIFAKFLLQGSSSVESSGIMW